MQTFACAALIFTISSAFEAKLPHESIQLEESEIMGENHVLRIHIKPTHHLMTDPFIMRLSQDEYEERFGSYEDYDRTGTEWFDSVIDHFILPTDVSHENETNFFLGTPSMPAGVCLFDNNLSDTILFQSSVYKDNIGGYDPSLSNTYVGEDNSHESGPMYGHNATDTMCLGEVCIANYPFYYATTPAWWDFRLDDDSETSENFVGGICGLGKQMPNSGSRAFLAIAQQEGFVADNIYAVNMSPHKYGKSYLTIGGYYEFDYKDTLYWYEVTGSEWNLNVPVVKLGDIEYHPVYDGAESTGSFVGKFQTGYPYIGLPEATFNEIKVHFERYYTNLQCRERNHWGICYIEDADCDWYTHIEMSLTLQIENHLFTMPMRNLMDEITIQGKKYCRLLVANDKYGTPEVIKIGDAFFKAFNAIFDVGDSKLGLALSRFGLPGNKIDVDWWVVTEEEIEAEEEREQEADPTHVPEPTPEPVVPVQPDEPAADDTDPTHEEETGDDIDPTGQTSDDTDTSHSGQTEPDIDDFSEPDHNPHQPSDPSHPVPGPTPLPNWDDVTDPEREQHDYENDRPGHTETYGPDGEGSGIPVLTWIVLIAIATVVIIVVATVICCCKKRKSNREARRKSFDMQYNQETEESDSDEDEEIEVRQPVKKKRKRSVHDHNTNYADAIDNDRVKKALMLAVNSRKDQTRLGNYGDDSD